MYDIEEESMWRAQELREKAYRRRLPGGGPPNPRWERLLELENVILRNYRREQTFLGALMEPAPSPLVVGANFQGTLGGDRH